MFFNIINSVQSAGGAKTKLTNPRTKEALWEVPAAKEADVDAAVKAARLAFQSWKDVPIEQRQKCLLKLAEQLESHREEMNPILAKETGKSDLLASMEIDDALSFIRFHATQSLPDEVEFEDAQLKIISRHAPIGVVAAICPWNFPLVLAATKIAPALVMGNCIIVKPSPYTPCATLKFAELAIPILPTGVFQALNDDNHLGPILTSHPGVDKIGFTGSTATGKKVMESAAKTLKRVTLELGGNDPSIVCPDVDVDAVAEKIATGVFFHSGQMCVATKRVFVHQSIFSQFRDAFVKAVEKIELDISGRKASLFSPMQNQMQYDIVKGLIAESREKKHRLIFPGEHGERQAGLFIPPVIVDRPPDDARVVQTEQFGPIIPLLEWSTEDDVLTRANYTDSGLGACVWARDISAADRIARKLEAGTVWINSFEIPHPKGYFSGWKHSGFGGEWGKQGLLSYSLTQTIQLYK